MRSAKISLKALAICAPIFGAANIAAAADLGGSYKDGGDPAGDYSIESLKVGGILIVKPKYEGSKEYDVIGFPYILPSFSGTPGFFSRIDARGLDDVRFKVIDRDGFVAGPLAGYNLGRDEDDGDRLEGLGDIDGGVVVGGFVGYRWNALLFDVSYHQILGDSDGYEIRFGVESERKITDRVTLTGRVGATYADDSYMQDFFGVSEAQSANSEAGLQAFDAEAGFKDVYAQVGIKADLDERWSAQASLRYSRLLGDAADSPVTESEDQFMGLFGLAYKFNVDK
ncbi:MULTISPECIES: MipA/OmpV family protein [Rhodomicrobium]|uniref:MipA/OmpV family protein n=1 Tax=Rhodomicrobium TaxID=1068 RepID=UPI000B4BC836|nr:MULTISPECIES: MipA/OmpV family protein [Rhodomicrobium]